MAAREIALPSGARAKRRDEGLVVLWTVLTLGVYTAVWYYRINREMRDFGRAHGDEKLAGSNPTLSILAFTLGSLLIVPAIVSYWKTTGRIRRMQGLCNVPLTEGWVIGVLYVLGLGLLLTWVAIPPYVQSGLNRVWGLYPEVDGGEAQLTPDGATTAEPAPALAPAPQRSVAPVPPQSPPPDPADRLDS